MIQHQNRKKMLLVPIFSGRRVTCERSSVFLAATDSWETVQGAVSYSPVSVWIFQILFCFCRQLRRLHSGNVVVLTKNFKKKKNQKSLTILAPSSPPFPSVVIGDARPSQFIATIIKCSYFGSCLACDDIFFKKWIFCCWRFWQQSNQLRRKRRLKYAELKWLMKLLFFWGIFICKRKFWMDVYMNRKKCCCLFYDESVHTVLFFCFMLLLINLSRGYLVQNVFAIGEMCWNQCEKS